MFNTKSISVLGGAAALMLSTAASADTFVLVHGAFQDASSWDRVVPLLEDAGHTVVAVDLPGRDAEGADAQAVGLADHIATAQAAVEAAGEPVILVGHSFGGMTISGVAEAVPDQVDLLVYLAAYIPVSGDSMESLALSDGDNRFTQQTFVIAADYSHATILPEHQLLVFAHDVNGAQADALWASMVREPLAPIATPIELTEASFGTVEKSYIRTLDDGAVSTPLQTMMIERAGVEAVTDIAGGHAPYLTRPEELAGMLLDIAAGR